MTTTPAHEIASVSAKYAGVAWCLMTRAMDDSITPMAGLAPPQQSKRAASEAPRLSP